jgi:hypothetical protein
MAAARMAGKLKASRVVLTVLSPPGQMANLGPAALAISVIPPLPAECLISTWSQWLVLHVGSACLMPHGAGLAQHIAAAPRNVFWLRN